MTIKSYTFFLVSFYYEEGEWDFIYSRISKWKPISTELYKGEDVLFPYIMDMFKQNNPDNSNLIIIYELDSKDKGINSEMCSLVTSTASNGIFSFSMSS